MKYVVYYRRKEPEGRFVTFADQQARVAAYLKDSPGNVVGEYTEVERGRRHTDRTELQRAIDHAVREEATLLFALVNRMSRNVAVTDMLLRATEKGPFHFIGCDSPTFNERTIHILATVAQALYIKISERQKSAMALCRASGMQLGSANPRHWKGLTRGWKKAIHAAAIAQQESDGLLPIRSAADHRLPRGWRESGQHLLVADPQWTYHHGRQAIFADGALALVAPKSLLSGPFALGGRNHHVAAGTDRC